VYCGVAAFEFARSVNTCEGVGVPEPDAVAIRLHQSSLAKSLQDDVRRFSRQTGQIAEITLAEMERDKHLAR